MGIFRQRKSAGVAPIAGRDSLLLDLDGVVYRGANAVPHAVTAINGYAQRGIRVGYITNNASRTDAAVAAQLSGFGLNTAPEDVVTSPQAAAHLLREHLAPGGLVLVVGGDGLVDELQKAGYRITRSADDIPDAVVQGFAQDVGWAHLAEASFALAREIPWIATNQDWTIPVARGVAPGNGTLVSAVHTAVQKLPIVAGKPETPLFATAVERFASSAPIMVGDRLDTDIKGARRADIASALVLTGIDGPKQLVAASPEERPDFILEDLRGLAQPYPEVEVSHPKPEVVTARVGTARVSLEGVTMRVQSRSHTRIDYIRAACAAIWHSDKMIYALELPESLLRPWDAERDSASES